MPEGPECRYIATSLNSLIKGDSLVSLKIHGGRYSRHGPPTGYQEFIDTLEGGKIIIEGVNVHGKFIWWVFSSGWYLLNTLGMSGQWLVTDTGTPPLDHCHLEFTCQRQTVWFRDIRNFGTLRFVNQKESLQKQLVKLGHNLFERLTRERWDKLLLMNSHRNITVFLMDQSQLAGVGNYLKAEALYSANVDPRLNVGEIEVDQLWDLYQDLVEIAERSYQAHGASFHSYKGPKGEKGEHGFRFRIYGLKVDSYGHPVERLKTPDGRTTYWVPEVQGLG